MKQIVVVYRSKYGSTKKYAEWIAQKLDAKLCTQKEASLKSLLQYDIIIYGGGLYAGGIAGFSKIKKHPASFAGKKLVVFGVGSSPASDEVVNEVKKRNLTQPMENIPLFYLRGALDYSSMTAKDKLLMNMLKKMLEKNKSAEKADWENGLLAHFYEKNDFTDIDNIKPLVEYVKGLE